MPSYAHPVAPNEERISGRIQSRDGKYGLEIRDDRGFISNVQMRQGTIINPTGITLQPGMSVTIYGENMGHTFLANQIDTPYRFVQAVPFYPGPFWGPPPPGVFFSPRFRFGWR